MGTDRPVAWLAKWYDEGMNCVQVFLPEEEARRWAAYLKSDGIAEVAIVPLFERAEHQE